LGDAAAEECEQPLYGALRGASNVHYSDVKSAIFLPRSNRERLDELIELLASEANVGHARLVADDRLEVRHLRLLLRGALSSYADGEIRCACQAAADAELAESVGGRDATCEIDESTIRKEELEVMCEEHDEPELRTSVLGSSAYGTPIAGFFAATSLVSRLRETRVLSGFSRVFPTSELTPQERISKLRLRHPRTGRSWLPAQVVYGEGILLQLDGERVREWESRQPVAERFALMRENMERAGKRALIDGPTRSARYVLVHTLAHLLMNGLALECGYGSAALRERIYVSSDAGAEMASLLIYTAAGDSEGTMGGLVRMGKPGSLEGIIRQALASACWCSADPVCMEAALRGGQGPGSCNLAACHNCALVPETACEVFNSYLDRGFLVGDGQNEGLGYFEQVVELGTSD